MRGGAEEASNEEDVRPADWDGGTEAVGREGKAEVEVAFEEGLG